MLDFYKLALAVFSGFIVGRQRKKNDKAGGARTYALVSLGATLIALLSVKLLTLDYLDSEIIRNDFARLMSYGIASIGFLGSGIIIQTKKGVEGLTSAASFWAIVPLGFFIGLGFFKISLVTIGLIYFILDYKYKHKE